MASSFRRAAPHFKGKCTLELSARRLSSAIFTFSARLGIANQAFCFAIRLALQSQSAANSGSYRSAPSKRETQ
jgi:hypothetical protein